MTPKHEYYDVLAMCAVKALKNRGFEAWYYEDKAKALEKALSLIPEGASVAWGGSYSINEIGLIAALKAGNYNLIDRASAANAEERKQLQRRAFFSDWYLGSANGLALTGEIVNIDGNGNRVAAMAYGPDNVLLIVGVNKIAPNEAATISRARNVAAPMNAHRFGLNTPCTEVGHCVNCQSKECICGYVTVTRFCRDRGRIKVIIVGDELGF